MIDHPTRYHVTGDAMKITIGIAGCSGSGKTALAQELVQSLPDCVVLSLDSYYRDLSNLPPGYHSGYNFDHPSALDWDLMADQLHQISRQEQVAVPVYDFKTHTRLSAVRQVGPCGVILVEGIYALWDERIRDLLDVAVFIDATEHVCLQRRIQRDTVFRGRTATYVKKQWQNQVQPMFQEHVRPTRHFAHCVIDGNRALVESCREVLGAIEKIKSKKPLSRLNLK